MALKFADFKTHVRLLTRENTASGTFRYASDANCLLIWSLIIPKINMLTHSNMVSNIASPILSVASQRLYSLPVGESNSTTPMQDLYDVYYNGKPLKYLTLTEARMSSGIGNPWWSRTGDPIRYYFENYKIGVYPVPTVSNVPIQVFGTSGVDLPANATDATATSQLDDRLSEAIIYAGCYYIMQSRREFDVANQFMASFKESMREYGQVEVDRLVRGETPALDLDPHERF